MSRKNIFQIAQKTVSGLNNQSAFSQDIKRLDPSQVYHDLCDESPETGILCGEARSKELLESITFGGLTTIHQIKIANGVCR